MKIIKLQSLLKYLKIFLDRVNISLNEMKIISDKFNVNIRDVINAASTKPYVFMKFEPGPGIGGHIVYLLIHFILTWKAKEYNIHTRFIELAGEINNFMPHWIFEKINHELNKKFIYKKNEISIIGASYKKYI